MENKIVIDQLGLLVKGNHSKSGYIHSLAQTAVETFGNKVIVKLESKQKSLLITRKSNYTFAVEY